MGEEETELRAKRPNPLQAFLMLEAKSLSRPAIGPRLDEAPGSSENSAAA